MSHWWATVTDEQRRKMEGVTRSNRYCIMRMEQAAQAHSLFQLLDVNPVRSTCCSFRKRRIYGGFGPFRVSVFLPDMRAKSLENSGNVHVGRSSDNLESRLPLSSLSQIDTCFPLCMSGINKVSDTRAEQNWGIGTARDTRTEHVPFCGDIPDYLFTQITMTKL